MTGNGKMPRAPAHLQREEHVATTYRVDIDEHIRLTGEDCDFEDLLKPTFWSRSTHILKVGDILRAVKSDKHGTLFSADLIVQWVGPSGCGVKLFGAIYGTEFYEQLKAIQEAQRAKQREALAASVVPAQEGGKRHDAHCTVPAERRLNLVVAIEAGKLDCLSRGKACVGIAPRQGWPRTGGERREQMPVLSQRRHDWRGSGAQPRIFASGQAPLKGCLSGDSCRGRPCPAASCVRAPGCSAGALCCTPSSSCWP